MKFTTQEIRGAILRAADSIAKDHSLWEYANSHIGGCGTPMCAAGWIGLHLGMPIDTHVNKVCEAIGIDTGVPYIEFDQRMVCIDTKWFWYPANAINALRVYADKFHPAPANEANAVVSWSDCIWQPKAVA